MAFFPGAYASSSSCQVRCTWLFAYTGVVFVKEWVGLGGGGALEAGVVLLARGDLDVVLRGLVVAQAVHVVLLDVAGAELLTDRLGGWVRAPSVATSRHPPTLEIQPECFGPSRQT